MANKQQLQQKAAQNTHVLDIFPVADLVHAWQKTTGKDIAQALGQGARFAANYASSILDAQVVLRMIKDLGVSGKVILKKANGKQYVIFKGYAGKRSIFTASRYLAQNPKVVDMAIGTVGVNRSIISGARLTIFLVVPLNILNYLLSDQQTLTELIGTTATDLIKVGVASAVASVAATTVASITTLAAGPLVVAIAVGLAVGYGLDKLDQHFGLTDALIKGLDNAYDQSIGKLQREFNREINKVERHLKWQIMHGLPVGQGIFY